MAGGEEWNSPYHPAVQIFGWTVALLMSLETILGNAMVVLAYRLDRSISKQLGNRFIVSLAVSDMIIGIEGIPLFTVYVLNGSYNRSSDRMHMPSRLLDDRWPLGSMACETWLFLDYTLCLVSILTVLLITVDRYMSVCHTARLILFSWVLPAFMFGLMIYGWPLLERDGQGASRGSTNGECYAPFLSNPYVNMSMYLAYYWTTLVAMLLLYKGIHQAARKLESKAKAKEHRHIALLLTQRLGTQVGVSLMLHSQRQLELAKEAENKDSLQANTSTTQLSNLEPSSNKNTLLAGFAPSMRRSFREKLKGSIKFAKPISSRAGANKECRMAPPFGNAVVGSTKENNKNGYSAVDLASQPPTAVLDSQQKVGEKEIIGVAVNSFDQTQESSISASSDNSAFDDDSLSSLLQFKTLSTLENLPPSYFSQVNTTNPSHFSYNNGYGRSSADEMARDVLEACFVPFAASQHSKAQRNTFERSRSGPGQFTQPIRKEEDERKRMSWHTLLGEFGGKPLKTVATGKKVVPPPPTVGSVDMGFELSVSQSTSEAKVELVVQPNAGTLSRQSDCSIQMQVPLQVLHHSDVVRRNTRISMDSISHPNASEPENSDSPRKVSSSDKILHALFSPISTFNKKRKRTKAELRAQKAFRTITFIVGLFAIAWSPYYIVATIYGFCHECIPTLVYNVTYYMCYFNSSVNPFAYALANRHFRSAFARILRGNFKRAH